MIAVVCGSRSHKLNDRGKEILLSTLIEHKALIVFHGAAPGIDKSAKEFVESKGFLTVPFPADWKKYGKSAGPRRNKKMCLYASKDEKAIHIRFFGGSGTKDCTEHAINQGLKMIDLSDMIYVEES